MIEIDKILKKYDLRTNSYKKIGKTILVNSNEGKLIFKEKINPDIFKYLDSRSFNYYPKRRYQNDSYDIIEYIDDTNMPDDQKMLDLINLVSLLHSKTTYYEKVDAAEYQKNYEEISSNIEYLFNYYNDLISMIETKVFMSPWEALLATNISSIFNSLEFAKEKLEEWYLLVKDKTKRRFAVIHNNLRIDHFIKNKNPYLISWDNSKIDIPIFDLYKLYKYHALDYDFEHILKKYEQNYPLLKVEKVLFFILICLPDKLELSNSIYDNCVKINHLIEYLTRTEKLISPYYSENTE